ncbi:UNVERIFIED_CONTAM: hypothetical protein FKN15_011625 [Acipenser sinensis]
MDEMLHPSGGGEREAVSAWDMWLVHRGCALEAGICSVLLLLRTEREKRRRNSQGEQKGSGTKRNQTALSWL